MLQIQCLHFRHRCRNRRYHAQNVRIFTQLSLPSTANPRKPRPERGNDRHERQGSSATGITVLLDALCNKLPHQPQPVMIAVIALTWAAIVVLSNFSYRWLEMPARRYINGTTFSASKACTS